jgi:hypothetical protein
LNAVIALDLEAVTIDLDPMIALDSALINQAIMGLDRQEHQHLQMVFNNTKNHRD